MDNTLRHWLVLLAALTLALAWGCDSEEGGNGDGGGGGGADADTGPDPDTPVTGDEGPGPDGGTPCTPTPINVSVPDDADPSCAFSAGDMNGTTMLVKTLVVEQPEEEFLRDTLNNLWAYDIEHDNLIILFNVIAHDTEANTLTVEAGSGELDGGTYKWLGEPNILDIALDGCTFATTTNSVLELFPPTINKPIIISTLAVAGQFSADGSQIVTANLAGTLRESDSIGLDVMLNPDVPDLKAPLVELLENAGVEKTADPDGDCKKDAWILAGTLTAEKVTNVDL